MDADARLGDEVLDACTDEELAEGIEQLHALVCASHSRLLRLVQEFAARGAFAVYGCRDMAAWLVARLGISARTAREWAGTAESLAVLPALAGLYAGGSCSFDKLRPLARVADPASDAALAADAPGLSAAGAEALARRVTPASKEDEAEAQRTRKLRLWQQGQATRLSGSLPGLDGEVVRQALERAAASYPPDPETGLFAPHEQRLADALVEMASGRLAEDSDAAKASVVVHVELDVLAGEDGPAETGSGAPLVPEAARRAACDCRRQDLVKDRASGLLDLGRSTRSIPLGLSRYLRHRDGGCRRPGCGSRRGTEGHHVVHWAKGGPTDRHNLLLLCRRCHRLVHEDGWTVEGDAEGVVTFGAPSGRVWRSTPVPLRMDIRDRFRGWLGPAPGEEPGGIPGFAAAGP